MKYILYLMFFVTPAFNLSKVEKESGYKDETKHIWSLQNVSTHEFPTRLQCRLAGANFLDEIKPVATVTVRGWCICVSDKDGDCKKLPDQKTNPKKISSALENLLADIKKTSGNGIDKKILDQPGKLQTFEAIDSPYVE